MAQAKPQSRRRIRPRSVTLVIWGVFLLGLANLWRAAGLVRQGDLLRELGAWPDPRLSAVVALVWAFLFVFAALALMNGRSSIRLVTPALLLGYAVYRLGLMWLGSGRSDGNNVSTAAILLYSTATLLTVWALNRRAIRWYF